MSNIGPAVRRRPHQPGWRHRSLKGACILHWSDVEEWNEGLVGILVADRADATNEEALSRLARLFGDRAYLALSLRRRPKDAIRLRDLAAQAAAARVPTVATGDVLYHSPDRHGIENRSTRQRSGSWLDEPGSKTMIDGTRHEFTGLISTDGPELVLRLSDARTWLLRAPSGIERYVGRYVRVAGVRRGAELHVDRIQAV